MLKNEINNKKLPLCFNLDNIFHFSHKKNKSSNLILDNQKTTTSYNTPYSYSCSNTTINNNINEQNSKTNISNLNINININTNREKIRKQNVIITNQNSICKINKIK